MDADTMHTPYLSLTHTTVIGKKIVNLEEVTSTNDVAKSLALQGEPEGTVVIADTQTAGKGRLSREWCSPRGGLYLSIILRPKLKLPEATRIVIFSAVATAETIRQYCPDARVKWPNDVLIGDKKICGILTELVTKNSKIDFVVVGIGVNVNLGAAALPKNTLVAPTSLKCELKKEVPLNEFAERLLAEFDRFYPKRFDEVLRRWRTYSATLGKNVRIESFDAAYEGKALDIDELGRLVLLGKDGKKSAVEVGDCVHLR
jgi:BirA family biotin operon repressor/biotin-[acetyl-CoA-carboxylase] ligase